MRLRRGHDAEAETLGDQKGLVDSQSAGPFPLFGEFTGTANITGFFEKIQMSQKIAPQVEVTAGSFFLFRRFLH